MNVQNILLLRGLAREQRHWGAFPAFLKQELPNTTLHMLDFPGIGTEIERRSPLGVAAIASDIRERFLTLRKSHPGPWICVSISLGSMVALEWCHAHPEDFKALVVINVSAANLNVPWMRMKPLAMAKLLKASQCSTPFQKERQILDVTTKLSDEQKNAMATLWSEFSAPRLKLAETALLQMGAAVAFRCPSNLEIPLRVLVGRQDKLCDPHCGRTLAKTLHTETFEHPMAGHDLPLDDSLWTSRQIREFMEGLAD